MMAESADIVGIDRRHVWHPYTQHATAGDPIAIARAEGAYLYDAAGRPIFDAISSWWVTLHGHGEPRIASAISTQAQQLEQVIFAGFTHAPAALLAQQLLRMAPRGLDRVFYTDDGSTAVEVALKIALQYWHNRRESRTTVVALEHAYHGDTFGAMSASARSTFNAAVADRLFDVVRLPDPSAHDAVDAFRMLLTSGTDVAAIIVEPMLMGAGGMRMWSAAMLAGLRDLAAQHDVIFIADEVMTGFGRTGPLFACDHAGITPDILCLSKGITGGFLPLGATLVTEKLFAAFASNDAAHTLYHGHSYTANPLACAAALASAALLDDESARRRQNIEHAHRSAADRFAPHPRVTNARVMGTVFAMEVDGSRGYLDPVGTRLRRFAIDRGVLLRPLGNTVYLLPPYCSTSGDLDRAYDVIAEFLGDA